MTYRDLLLSRLRRGGGSWQRFKAAPRSQIRATLQLWRPRLAPTQQRPEALDALRRDVPQCLDNVARSAAGILALRPALGKVVGTDDNGVLDLVNRRVDCSAIAAGAAQIEQAAVLAQRDAAAALSDDNERARRGLATALADPATTPAERATISGHLNILNNMAEMALHLRAIREQQKARGQAEGDRALAQQGRDQEITAVAAQLIAGR